MASTYSSNLKLQLMTTGENSTTWGTVTNTNLGTALEEAIVGSADVTFSSGNETISLSNSNATQAARHIRLNLTGTTGGSTRTLTVPDVEKVYIVNNACADAIEVKNSTGSNVSVPAGTSTWVYSTGSNVVDVVTSLTSLTVGGTAVVTENGTQTLTNKTLTAPTINDGALGANTTATTQSTGDNTTKIATTAYVAQEIATEHVDTTQLVDGAVTTAKIEDDAITAAKIGDNEVGAAALNISGNGTAGQVVLSDGDGSFSYGANNTYSDSDVESLFSVTGSAPIFAARAWARFDGTEDAAINSSGNIASISRTTAGQYTVTFTTAMPDTDYAFIARVNGVENGEGREYQAYATTRNTGSVVIHCMREETENYVDANDISFVIFR